MKKEDIHLSDWERILVGDNPWGFLIEVFGRTLIIYLCLMIVMRLLGKRMNAQLTITDLAVMLTLGAIASMPMQSFERGLLPGIVLLTCILIFHQAATRLIYRKRSVEVLTQGKVTAVIKEGVIDPTQLKRMRISKEQIFSILRSQGVRHLGQVKRLYSEANGHFSLFEFPEPRPGLTVFPGTDNALQPTSMEEYDYRTCCNCGNVIKRGNNYPVPCKNCGYQEWMPAVK